MRTVESYQTYYLGTSATWNITAKSASGPTATDGTAWVAQFMDDYLFGPQQALFYAVSQTYSGSAESYTASDWLTALGKYICNIAFTEKSYVNLVVKNNVATPNSKIDITCNSIYVGWKKHTSVSLTVDITVSGALGLDTGTESADAIYYIWLIAKLDGTLSAVFSASATAPTMPSGYVFSRILTSWYNLSNNFVAQTKNIDDTGAQFVTFIPTVTNLPVDATTKGFYVIRGKHIEMRGQFVVTSNATSEIRINLPPGMTMTVAKNCIASGVVLVTRTGSAYRQTGIAACAATTYFTCNGTSQATPWDADDPWSGAWVSGDSLGFCISAIID